MYALSKLLLVLWLTKSKSYAKKLLNILPVIEVQPFLATLLSLHMP